MTTEMNKVIADFMGWVHHHDEEYDAYEMENLQYHVSFGPLLPVWFKVQQAGQQYPDFRTHDKAFYDGMRNGSIEKCHKAVYEAIIWLNQKQKV